MKKLKKMKKASCHTSALLIDNRSSQTRDAFPAHNVARRNSMLRV